MPLATTPLLLAERNRPCQVVSLQLTARLEGAADTPKDIADAAARRALPEETRHLGTVRLPRVMMVVKVTLSRDTISTATGLAIATEETG